MSYSAADMIASRVVAVLSPFVRHRRLFEELERPRPLDCDRNLSASSHPAFVFSYRFHDVVKVVTGLHMLILDQHVKYGFSEGTIGGGRRISPLARPFNRYFLFSASAAHIRVRVERHRDVGVSGQGRR
jgi:hypothetical protein